MPANTLKLSREKSGNLLCLSCGNPAIRYLTFGMISPVKDYSTEVVVMGLTQRAYPT